jgi:hypothetical protein
LLCSLAIYFDPYNICTLQTQNILSYDGPSQRMLNYARLFQSHSYIWMRSLRYVSWTPRLWLFPPSSWLLFHRGGGWRAAERKGLREGLRREERAFCDLRHGHEGNGRIQSDSVGVEVSTGSTIGGIRRGALWRFPTPVRSGLMLKGASLSIEVSGRMGFFGLWLEGMDIPSTCS